MDLNGKLFVTPDEFYTDSVDLAMRVYDSGFRPNYLVGIWRGGCVPGMVVQEVLELKGCKTDHIAIRTSSREHDGSPKDEIAVHNLHYLLERFVPEDRLLIVDDVFDTGKSLEAVVSTLKTQARRNTPEMRLATVYYKPTKNETSIKPDYFIHETDKWIVFPHELHDMTTSEIAASKGQRVAQLLRLQ